MDANEYMINKILCGEHDLDDSLTLQAKASAAAAAVRLKISSTGSSILSHARANLKGEYNVADTDMDGKAHGVDQCNTTDNSRNKNGRDGTSSGGGRYSGDHAQNNTPAAPTSTSQSGTANKIIGDIGKRFSLLGESVKTLASEKIAEIRDVVPSGGKNRSNSGSNRQSGSSEYVRGSSRGNMGDAERLKPSFTIEDDEETTSNSTGAKTKEERALAMANHVMAGLQKEIPLQSLGKPCQARCFFLARR